MSGVVKMLPANKTQTKKSMTNSETKAPEEHFESKDKEKTRYDIIKRKYVEFAKRLKFKSFKKSNCLTESSSVLENNTQRHLDNSNNIEPLQSAQTLKYLPECLQTKISHSQNVFLKHSPNETSNELPSSSDESERKHSNRRLKAERRKCDEYSLKPLNRRVKEERSECDESKLKHLKIRIKKDVPECDEYSLTHLNRRVKNERLECEESYLKNQNIRIKKELLECDEYSLKHLNRRVKKERLECDESSLKHPIHQIRIKKEVPECDEYSLKNLNRRVRVQEERCGASNLKHSNKRLREERPKREESSMNNTNIRVKEELLECEKSHQKHPNRRLKRERLECEMPAKRERIECEIPVKRERIECEIPANGERLVCEMPAKRERLVCEMPVKRARLSVREPKRVVVAVAKHLGFYVKRSKGKITEIKRNKEKTKEIQDNFTDYDTPSSLDNTFNDGDKTCLNYQKMLGEFILHKTEEVEKDITLYEKRIHKILNPASRTSIDFYIPPAQVEVIFQRMVDQTAEGSLRSICEFRKWPEPEMKCLSSGKAGYLYSCTVMTKTVIPKKPASNEDLARELAAVSWLEWLGFPPRAMSGIQALAETYF